MKAYFLLLSGKIDSVPVLSSSKDDNKFYIIHTPDSVIPVKLLENIPSGAGYIEIEKMTAIAAASTIGFVLGQNPDISQVYICCTSDIITKGLSDICIPKIKFEIMQKQNTQRKKKVQIKTIKENPPVATEVNNSQPKQIKSDFPENKLLTSAGIKKERHAWIEEAIKESSDDTIGLEIQIKMKAASKGITLSDMEVKRLIEKIKPVYAQVKEN